MPFNNRRETSVQAQILSSPSPSHTPPFFMIWSLYLRSYFVSVDGFGTLEDPVFLFCFIFLIEFSYHAFHGEGIHKCCLSNLQCPDSSSFAQQKFVSAHSPVRCGLAWTQLHVLLLWDLVWWSSSLSDIIGCLSGGWHTNHWALQPGSGVCNFFLWCIGQNYSHGLIHSSAPRPATCPKAESWTYLVNMTNDYPK